MPEVDGPIMSAPAVAENQPDVLGAHDQNRMTITDSSLPSPGVLPADGDPAFEGFARTLLPLFAMPPAPWTPEGAPHPLASDEAFLQLARQLLALQFERVPVYRRLATHRGIDPTQVRCLTEIPALPTSTFKDHAVTSLCLEDRVRVFHSSGTTGQQPSRHHHSHASLAWYEASARAWFKPHLLPDPTSSRPCFVCLTPTAAATPHSSLVHMVETVSRTWGGRHDCFVGALNSDGAWLLDTNRMEAALAAAVQSNQPLCLLGTAFMFVHWLDHVRAMNRRFQLPDGSCLLETGGYKGRTRAVPRPELHRQLSEALGMPDSHIVGEYGMSELSSQAYDNVVPSPGATQPNQPRVFRFPPWARSLVISPEHGGEVEEGGIGLLRVLDLANVRSVMAVQTEDLAIRRGNGFELLGRAPGAEPRGCSLAAA